MSASKPQALCLVLAQNKPDVSTEKFNDWCEAENARFEAVPQVSSALRYRATDEQEPEWLTLYDIESPDAISSPECVGIAQQLPVLQKRSYSLVDQRTGESGGLPAEYLLVVHWSVKPEDEEEFEKWYKEEHLGEVVAMPGCLRGRRYKLVESKDLVPREGPAAYPHTILYDWDDPEYWKEKVIKMDHTPWTKQMLGKGKMDIRRYSRYRGVNE